MRRKNGFTLVELLVVIGIIAVLVGVLLPALGRAKKQANTVKCLAQMRQFGNCFMMYAQDNGGWWPMSFCSYAPPGMDDKVPANRTRVKRWPDFLGKYWNNNRLVNPDGTDTPDTVNPPRYDLVSTIKDRNSVIWGCPSWQQNQVTHTIGSQPNWGTNTTTSSSHMGYAMNVYALAPASTSVLRPDGTAPWTYRAKSGTTAQVNGWFFKQTQYTKPAERCLIAESGHRDMSVTPTVPWWTAFGWTTMPPVEDISSMTLDFNRHGKLAIGNKYDDPSLNELYCDGHAATVSLRESIRSIRFNAP